jgi:hypothetical protein
VEIQDGDDRGYRACRDPARHAVNGFDATGWSSASRAISNDIPQAVKVLGEDLGLVSR